MGQGVHIVANAALEYEPAAHGMQTMPSALDVPSAHGVQMEFVLL